MKKAIYFILFALTGCPTQTMQQTQDVAIKLPNAYKQWITITPQEPSATLAPTPSDQEAQIVRQDNCNEKKQMFCGMGIGLVLATLLIRAIVLTSSQS